MFDRRYQIRDTVTPDIERLLEMKIIEIDKNLLFSFAFEDILPNICEVCENIAEKSTSDIKCIVSMLLKNNYNPTVRINADFSSVNVNEDKQSRAPYTAISVINHNILQKRKICGFIRNLLKKETIRKLNGGYETLNAVYLGELKTIDKLNEYLNK